jgi:hypothetical protein
MHRAERKARQRPKKERGQGKPPKSDPGRRTEPARPGRAEKKGSGVVRQDAANIAGLTFLMNPQHIRAGISLPEAERQIMGRAAPVRAERPPAVDELGAFTADLDRIASDLGISLLDDAGDEPAPDAEQKGGPAPPEPAAGPASPGPPRPGPPAERPGPPPAERPGPPPAERPSAPASHAPPEPEEDEEDDEDGEDEEDDEEDDDESAPPEAPPEAQPAAPAGPAADDDENVEDIIARFDAELKLTPAPAARKMRLGPATDAVPQPGYKPPDPQKSRVREALADLRGEARAAPSTLETQILDDKALKLEKIARLRQTLDDEGVDCSAIGPLTVDSSTDEIDRALLALRIKNDNLRCTSVAEEILVGGAEILGDVFDGTREVPLVGWKPDYSGFASVVYAKISRMRLETSQVVSQFFTYSEIGPLTRIIMEMLPSLFLYPRQQERQRGGAGLSRDPRFAGPQVADPRAAMSAIRSADAQRRLDDI